MLHLSWLTPFLLLSLASVIETHPIYTDASSIRSFNTTSPVTSDSVDATIPGADGECYDIRYCRTLEGLVQSCILTILACVWFAVHRNIPGPRINHPQHRNFFVRIGLFIWHKILAQRQAAIVFVVALLAPEWILAWALRQFLAARALAKELEEARIDASEAQESAPSDAETEKEFNESSDDGADAETLADSSGISTHSEHSQLIQRQLTSQGQATARKLEKSWDSQLAIAARVGKDNEAWKMPHAFFVIMGGYHFYNKARPGHPLSPPQAVELVKRGHLVAPTSDELANQSKGDALSKGVAILQTLWFVMQCIARRIERLPVTSLEVMTLAYTVITVAMYAVWWDKPLNVSCAVRVPEEEVEGEIMEQYESVWERIMAYILGNQDRYVDLRHCTRVPTFWAGDPGEIIIYGDVIALLVAMVFGAVHCIAWFDTFQSPLEQQLWRASAIAIIAVPAALALVLVIASLIQGIFSASDTLPVIITGVFYGPLALIYVAARVSLIVISFTSLSMLPPAAYHSVQWTTFIPHI
ncbi:hypothetical protein HWV62_10819 [Athelia sp. TMB]|nr:hypothetical protein HWV62_10819 [Athelia sp. TMB]